MFGGLKKQDSQLLMDTCRNFQDLILGNVNEFDVDPSMTKDPRVKEVLEEVSSNAKAYIERRNADYIQSGILALSVFRTKRGHMQIADQSANMSKYSNASGAVKEISRNFQDLINTLNGFFVAVEAEFQRMRSNDFSHRLSLDNWDGDVKKLVDNIALLQDSIAEQARAGLTSSMALQEDSSSLSHNSDELSRASNEQASSLEETAAAIEQMTGNISATANQADEMTAVAKEAKQAAESGNSVAKSGLAAMNEIFEATEAINQAVEVIDNIAFQTNILSLNAAVEAATAGDAGKGFAVVAQEVRNLANRSAEAAKQIQELARAARTKSEGGLTTTQNVMDSFSLISQKIAQTDEMVRNVANASREQMTGISQINDAVAQLDQMTQHNAKLANNTRDIAQKVLVLADDIFNDANNKKFNGKEQILATNNIIATQKPSVTHEKRHETPTISRPSVQAPVKPKITPTVNKVTNDNDIWESF